MSCGFPHLDAGSAFPACSLRSRPALQPTWGAPANVRPENSHLNIVTDILTSGWNYGESTYHLRSIPSPHSFAKENRSASPRRPWRPALTIVSRRLLRVARECRPRKGAEGPFKGRQNGAEMRAPPGQRCVVLAGSGGCDFSRFSNQYSPLRPGTTRSRSPSPSRSIARGSRPMPAGPPFGIISKR